MKRHICRSFRLLMRKVCATTHYCTALKYPFGQESYQLYAGLCTDFSNLRFICYSNIPASKIIFINNIIKKRVKALERLYCIFSL